MLTRDAYVLGALVALAAGSCTLSRLGTAPGSDTGGAAGMAGDGGGPFGGGGAGAVGGMAGAGGMAGSGGMAGNGGMAGSGGMVVECDGDGVIDAGEECDDMNGDAGDGCEDCVVVCPGWIKDPNPPHHCYRVFTDQQNWATSRTECQDEAPSEGFPAGSTELAAISSDPEMTFLEAVVAPLTDGPWLGAIESMATDCQYSWSNGEPWGWSPNPDPTPSTGLTDKPWNMGGPVAPPCNTYTCVHIYNTGRFHEEMCTTPHGRLCEFTPPGN